MERFFVMTQELESRLENQPKDILWGDGRLINSMGFLNTTIMDGLKTLPKIMEEGSAIIIAEGGMGKTFLLDEMEQFYPSEDVLKLDLVLYVNDEGGLKDHIRSANSKKYLLIDSFDEAIQLASCLLKELKSLGGSVHVILASRGILQLTPFCRQLKWPMYSLLPYSEENVLEIAQKQLSDGDKFLEEVKKKNIGSVCAKPLGCELLMSSFKEGCLTNISNRDLWGNAIEKLCAENSKSDSHFFASNTLLTCKNVLDIAIQIALVLKLSNASIVSSVSGFTDGIDFSHVIQSFDAKKFNECLKRSIFLAIDTNHYKFSHSSYFDFLAAEGLVKYVAPSEWQKIIFAPNGQPYPQWEGALQWIVEKDDKILGQVAKVRPDLLLGSDVVGDKVSIEEICNLILENADTIPEDVRETPAIQSRFYLLNTAGCIQSIQNVLRDSRSESKIDVAFDIVREARLLQVMDSVVAFFCDSTKSDNSRIAAGYVLLEFANKEQRKMCRCLLNTSISNRVKGLLLKLLWPKNLSTKELVSLLTPRRELILDSYSLWLSDDFLKLLVQCSNEDLLELLKWANDKDIGSDEDYHFSQALCGIFLHCWKTFDAQTRQGLMLLAKGLEKYASKYRSPFLDRDRRQSSNFKYTEGDYKKDTIRRQQMIRFIIENEDVSLSPIKSFRIGLIQNVEDVLFLIQNAKQCTNQSFQERWINCIAYYSNYINHSQYSSEWNWLHEQFPTVFKTTIEEELNSCEASHKRWQEMQTHLEQEKKEWVSQRDAECGRAANFVKGRLKKTSFKDFPYVMETIRNQTDGPLSNFLMDFRKSRLWPMLSKDEINSLVKMAYEFICSYNGPTGTSYYPEHLQAFYLLCAFDKEKLMSLSSDKWQKFAPELLKLLDWDNCDLVRETVKAFMDSQREVFLKELEEKFRRELNDENLNLFGLDKFKDLLPSGEMSLLLSKLDDGSLTSIQKAYLYEEFWEIIPDVTLAHLRELDFVDIKLSECEDELIPYSIVCNPEKRFQELLELFTQDTERGKQWILKVLGYDCSERGVFSQILPQLPVMVLANFYIWLRTQFPPEKESKHVGCRSTTQLDYVRGFISRIFNTLIESNDDELPNALGRIWDKFPSLTRLREFKLQAERKLLEKGCPSYSIDVIKSLMEKKTGLVNSANDLLDIVCAGLEKFQTVLTGAETPLVKLLWNVNKNEITHKKEEDLSDFLKYVLEQELKNCVINREVQLRGRQGGTPGTRTDIWITALSKEDNVRIKLCIEVKGSWNGEYKTAFKNQLCEKYMAEGGADAGIFLVGWFERKTDKVGNAWSIKEGAQKELEAQEKQLREDGYRVRGVVVDCTY